MAAKKRLRMRGVKQTPKRLEEEILHRSQMLAEDPGLLRPMCAGDCRKCAFDKPFKSIDALTKYKDDPNALLKLASRGGDDLTKAYAGTISLAAAGKIPMLATATIAGEKVPFAVRGAVGNDKLIGCQYYNDPKLRLFYYNTFIKKNKLHLYSFEDGIVCSNHPNMPEDYLYETFWESPYEFKDDGLDCGHEGAMVLDIKIKSRNEHIRICEDCAKDVSTVRYLVERICAVDPLDDLEVNVIHSYHAANESDKETIDGDLLKKYLRGEISDSILLNTVKRNKLGNLKTGDVATYIIGVKNYGSDLASFIGDISGSDREKATLTEFLGSNPVSLVLKNGKSTEALASLWDEHWKELIELHTSKDIASKYRDRPKNTPGQVLEEAYDKFISADVVESLPVFKRPGYFTSIADDLAKAAKVSGRDKVVKTIGEMTLRNTKARSLAAAFVIACEPNSRLPLVLTCDEREFTDFLMPFAKNVIDSKGEKYRDAMNTLLMAVSSGESV